MLDWGRSRRSTWARVGHACGAQQLLRTDGRGVRVRERERERERGSTISDFELICNGALAAGRRKPLFACPNVTIK